MCRLGASASAKLLCVADINSQRSIGLKKMKVILISAVAMFLTASGVWTSRGVAGMPEVRTPVLVELFTSEGCSSCPPADQLLEALDRQPTAGAELIVLSEHVDYWNHIGWKDPYSRHFFSDRQNGYARRFGLDSVYTPQMVVDGSAQFVGSDSTKAAMAFASAERKPKIPVRLSRIGHDASGGLQAYLEVGKLQSLQGWSEAEVYIAVALNRAESQVSSGENAGRRLAHTAVVRSLTRIGVLRQGHTMTQDVHLKLESGADLNNLRLIGFVQEPRQGRVLGATIVRFASQN